MPIVGGVEAKIPQGWLVCTAKAGTAAARVANRLLTTMAARVAAVSL
jgi:hypothetical protein